MARYDGKTAFITGASAGIGAQLARELARQGADVALVARRGDRIESLAREIQGATGRRVVAITGDVTEDGSIERAAANAREALGKIDVVIANAGFGVTGRVDKLSLDDFRRQFETNVFGVLRTVYATLDDIKQHQGRLAIVGSVSGHIGTPTTAAYCMSKFAVHGLAESLGHELAASGASVTLISPGFVASEIRLLDGKGELHEGAADPVPAWLVMPTDKAARQMAAAIYRREREAVITLHGKAAVFLQRHAPWLVAAVLRRARM